MRSPLFFAVTLVVGMLVTGCIGGSFLPIVPPSNPEPGGSIHWGVEYYPLTLDRGQSVEFCIWWINNGPAVVAEIDYRLEIDGEVVESGKVDPFTIPVEGKGGKCTEQMYTATPSQVFRWVATAKWAAVSGTGSGEYSGERGICWSNCGPETRRPKFW